MAVEKLTRFRSRLEVLRNERERLKTEIMALTRQLEEVDLAIKNCLHLRAEDLKRDKQERANSVSHKKK